jgi:hypothetical protein
MVASMLRPWPVGNSRHVGICRTWSPSISSGHFQPDRMGRVIFLRPPFVARKVVEPGAFSCHLRFHRLLGQKFDVVPGSLCKIAKHGRLFHCSARNNPAVITTCESGAEIIRSGICPGTLGISSPLLDQTLESRLIDAAFRTPSS